MRRSPSKFFQNLTTSSIRIRKRGVIGAPRASSAPPAFLKRASPCHRNPTSAHWRAPLPDGSGRAREGRDVCARIARRQAREWEATVFPLPWKRIGRAHAPGRVARSRGARDARARRRARPSARAQPAPALYIPPAAQPYRITTTRLAILSSSPRPRRALLPLHSPQLAGTSGNLTIPPLHPPSLCLAPAAWVTPDPPRIAGSVRPIRSRIGARIRPDLGEV